MVCCNVVLCKVEGSCFSFCVWVYCDLLCVVNSCVLVAVFCFGCEREPCEGKECIGNVLVESLSECRRGMPYGCYRPHMPPC